MTAVTPNTILERAPELGIEVDGSGSVTVHHGGRSFLFGPDALSLLDVFSVGCSLIEALGRLAPRLKGRRALDDTVACAAQMVSAGILAEPGRPAFSELSFPRGGYDASYVQIRMLEDTARKNAFIAAINEVVRHDDVVLDLGTGSGILAVAAAQAGARCVYAIEPSGMIRIAEAVASTNGVADRIRFIRGWSAHVDLPEPATVLTTDLIGNESLEMRLWEVVADARQRLLAPGATIVPASVTTKVCLVAAPGELLRAYRPDREHIRRWQAAYGIDFRPFLDAARGSGSSFYVEPSVAAGWEVLSAPVVAYHVPLATDPAPFTGEQEVVVSSPGLATAFLSFLEAELSPSTTLSTAPSHGSASSHWFCACWMLDQPVQVTPGDRLGFRYEYRGDGRSLLSPLVGVPV